MSKSQDQTFNKKALEEKKKKKMQEKQQKKEERRAKADKAKSMDDMLAYVDEFGNITSVPPDPNKKSAINLDDIQIGVSRKKEEPASAEDGRRGTVTFFNTAKGYGFIKDSKTQESIFVHVNGLLNPIKENDKVTFQTEMGQKGLVAVKVKLI